MNITMNTTSIMPQVGQFLRELIQIEGLPTHERATALRVLQELTQLGFDEAWLDEAGNVFGLYLGSNNPAQAQLWLTHLDHIDVGDLALWPYPPFAGAEHDGIIYGRGAVDIKGPLAAQVYAVAALKAKGIRPRQSIVVAAVVEEETGGAGARFLAEHLPLTTPMGRVLEVLSCIVGEPSSNRVMLGHRGIAQFPLRFTGRAHHASFALNQHNPHFALAVFLARLQAFSPPSHPTLGQSTLVPTMIRADTQSRNLTPNNLELILDWRTTGEHLAEMQAIMAELTEDLPVAFHIPALWAVEGENLNTPGFVIEPQHLLVTALTAAVTAINPQTPAPGIWNFATDGRWLARAGIACVGFGPGNPQLAHTTQEQIELQEIAIYIDMLVEFVKQTV
jgi:succinyl-diaminopimelate desuccinylase